MTLKEWLTQNNMTLAAASQAINCSTHAMRKWFTGERTPRPQYQKKIMALTNGLVTPNDWIKLDK